MKILILVSVSKETSPGVHTGAEQVSDAVIMKAHRVHQSRERKTVIILVQLKITIMLFNCAGKNLFRRAW